MKFQIQVSYLAIHELHRSVCSPDVTTELNASSIAFLFFTYLNTADVNSFQRQAMEDTSTLFQLHRSFVRRRHVEDDRYSRRQHPKESNQDSLYGRENENRKRKQTEDVPATAQDLMIHSLQPKMNAHLPNFNGHVVTTRSSKDTGNSVWDHYMTNYHDVPLGRFHIPMSPSAASFEPGSPMTMDTSSDSRDSWSSDSAMTSTEDMNDGSPATSSSSVFPRFSPLRPTKSRRLLLE
jgi:hypothetical protein